MPPLRSARTAAVLVLVLGSAGCTGGSSGDGQADGGGGGRSGAPAAACDSGSSRVLRTLVDDRSALPAGNWVPVVRATGDFRGRLVRLDQVTRLVSAGDVAAVASATGDDRSRAVRAGVADVPRKRVGRTFRLAVPHGTTSTALGELYAAALERLGSPTTVSADEAGRALGAVEAGRADVALVQLPTLAEAVGADVPTEAGVREQARAVAAAARGRRLALGDPAETSGTAQVLAPEGLVEEHRLESVSDLAAACAGGTLAATPGAEDAAADLAETYGLEVVDEPATDPTAVFGDDESVVAVVVAPG